MSKMSNKLQRLGSLLSASDPDAVERCGAQEKFGVWVQAVPLVITPLFGFIGAAYAAHDIQTARAGGAALSAPALVLVPAAVGLVYACLLFAIDWKIARSLGVDLGGKRKAALIVPRLLLAAFTAFLISVPLKAFLFEDEIRKFLLDEKQGKKAVAAEGVARLSDRLRGVPDAPRCLEAEAAVGALGREAPELVAMQGRASAARVAWDDRKAERSAVAARLSAAHAQESRAGQAGPGRLVAEIGGAYRQAGFTGKVVALARLAAESRVHALLMVGVCLLFLLLGVAPVLVRLMSLRDG